MRFQLAGRSRYGARELRLWLDKLEIWTAQGLPFPVVPRCGRVVRCADLLADVKTDTFVVTVISGAPLFERKVLRIDHRDGSSSVT